MTDSQIHQSNLILIDGAVFEGKYESIIRRRTAAEWLNIFGHDPKAARAIRMARDGVEGVAFKESAEIEWHLRRADA